MSDMDLADIWLILVRDVSQALARVILITKR